MISKHQNPFTAQAISSAGDSIVLHSEKSPQWTLPHIKSILRNEKYCHSSPTLDEAPLQQVQSLREQIVDHEGDRLVSGALQRVRVNGLQSFDLRHKKPPDKRIRAETSLQSRL